MCRFAVVRSIRIRASWFRYAASVAAVPGLRDPSSTMHSSQLA
jgi:hypothetical protein